MSVCFPFRRPGAGGSRPSSGAAVQRRRRKAAAWAAPIAGVAAFALASAPAAAQQFTVLGRAGNWTAEIGRSNTGRPMCLLGASDSPTGRSLYLKYFHGSDRIAVHAFKRSWDIPPGSDVRVELRVDAAPGWQAVASTIGSRRDAIEFSVTTDTVDRFEALFRAGAAMVLSFPSGSEPDWRLGLSGSNAMFGLFVRCMFAVNGGGGGGGGGGTQPHAGSGAGAPAQPHGAGAPAASPPLASQPVLGGGPARRT